MSIGKLSEIKGLGEARVKKLKAAGVKTIEDLAAVDAKTLSKKTKIAEKTLAKIIKQAEKQLSKDLVEDEGVLAADVLPLLTELHQRVAALELRVDVLENRHEDAPEHIQQLGKYISEHLSNWSDAHVHEFLSEHGHRHDHITDAILFARRVKNTKPAHSRFSK